MSILVPPIGWSALKLQHMQTYNYSNPFVIGTFSGFDFGQYSTNRHIFVTVSAGSVGPTEKKLNLTGNAIGDDTSPNVLRNNSDAANQSIAAILTGTPSAGQGSVTLSFDGVVGYIHINVYKTNGLSSKTHAAASSDSGNGSTLNFNINTVENSLLIASATVFNTGISSLWTGITERTTRDNGQSMHLSADYRPSSAESPRAVSLSLGAASDGAGILGRWDYA